MTKKKRKLLNKKTNRKPEFVSLEKHIKHTNTLFTLI